MSLKISFTGATDPGKTRKNNEDNFIIDNDLGLAIVADGMGGHNSGEVASKIAVTVTRDKFKDMKATSLKPSNFKEKFRLETNQLAFAVQMANNVIYETGNSSPENKGMGTTITAVFFYGEKLSSAHVGDSRVYLIREGAIYQISQDHSLVMEQVRKGVLTKEQAEQSPLQNILTRALGTQKTIDIDMSEIELRAGDRLLLCTDGLFKAVREEEVLELLKKEKNPEKACKALITTANQNGGPDNITVIIAETEKKKFKEKIKDIIWGR